MWDGEEDPSPPLLSLRGHEPVDSTDGEVFDHPWVLVQLCLELFKGDAPTVVSVCILKEGPCQLVQFLVAEFELALVHAEAKDSPKFFIVNVAIPYKSIHVIGLLQDQWQNVRGYDHSPKRHKFASFASKQPAFIFTRHRCEGCGQDEVL